MGRMRASRISYVKKPMASGSILSLGASVCGLILFGIGIHLSITTQGNIPIGGTAVCFSSFLFSLAGVRYGFAALKDNDRKYILARASVLIGGLLSILWLVMVLIGIKH